VLRPSARAARRSSSRGRGCRSSCKCCGGRRRRGIDGPDAALSLIARARAARTATRVSTLDQLAAATEGRSPSRTVLQLLGAVEEEALFRLCDLIVDRDTAGALVFVEELSEQGQDLGRLVTDLLEHLRHLMLVQHMGEVPETLPVTEETRERLRAQANQLGEATVLSCATCSRWRSRTCARAPDPRLPLELALVKVTRPGADLSAESISFRLEQLEQRGPSAHVHVPATTPRAEEPQPEATQPPEPPSARAGAAPEAWQRS
jgi:DNA polymerase-3 subunit gamma/tau